MWQGTRKDAVNPWGGDDSWKGHFQGHNIVNAVFQEIKNFTVTELILTGCSAGGIGTFGNCDFAAETFPDAMVACRPEAGWFGLPIATYDEFTKSITPADPHHFSTINWTAQIETYTPQTEAYKTCVQKADFDAKDVCANNAEKCCQSVPYIYPYLKTPIFVSENSADSYQCFTQGRCPHSMTKDVEDYVLYLRNLLTMSMGKKVVNGGKKDQDGLFAPACLAHAMHWNDSPDATVEGKNLQQAFGDWYFKRGENHFYLNNSTSVKDLLSCYN